MNNNNENSFYLLGVKMKKDYQDTVSLDFSDNPTDTNEQTNSELSKGEQRQYLVWVGGVLDYEGTNLNEAFAIYTEWIEQGYEEVVMETIKEKK